MQTDTADTFRLTPAEEAVNDMLMARDRRTFGNLAKLDALDALDAELARLERDAADVRRQREALR
jgi:hypothetical protein